MSNGFILSTPCSSCKIFTFLNNRNHHMFLIYVIFALPKYTQCIIFTTFLVSFSHSEKETAAMACSPPAILLAPWMHTCVCVCARCARSRLAGSCLDWIKGGLLPSGTFHLLYSNVGRSGQATDGRLKSESKENKRRAGCLHVH